MLYALEKTLNPMGEEWQPGPGEVYAEVLPQQVYAQKYSDLVRDHLLLRSMEAVNHCKVDVFEHYILGTLAIPVPGRFAEESWNCGFYMDRRRLIFIGDTERVSAALEKIEDRQIVDLTGPASLLFEFLETLVAGDRDVIDQYEKNLSSREDEITANVNEVPKGFEEYVLRTRKELAALCRYYKQLSQVGHVLSECPTEWMEDAARQMFRFFTGKAERLAADTESLREYALQIRDMYQARIDVRNNKVIQFLTIITTIFMPLTLITGWYGMNFQDMPELSWVHGYGMVIGLAALILVVEFLIFKKKKWL